MAAELEQTELVQMTNSRKDDIKWGMTRALGIEPFGSLDPSQDK